MREIAGYRTQAEPRQLLARLVATGGRRSPAVARHWSRAKRARPGGASPPEPDAAGRGSVGGWGARAPRSLTRPAEDPRGAGGASPPEPDAAGRGSAGAGGA